MSLAGEAVTTLPTTVPRARICGAPTSAQAPGAERTPVQRAIEFGLRPWREIITPHEDVAA